MPKSFPKSEYPENIVFKPSKKSISKVALLTGCVQKAISPNINDSSINVFKSDSVSISLYVINISAFSFLYFIVTQGNS